MKKTGIKIAAGVMAGVIVVGSLASTAIAQGISGNDSVGEKLQEEIVSEKNIENSENSEAMNSVTEEEPLSLDDEVVYVFTNADGTVRKVMDSVWIEEDAEKEQKPEEADLPVNVKITYSLNGNEISAEEIAGKSGHVKVRFDFEDLKYENRKVNGENRKVYVPFMAAAMAVLDSENFEEITVSTGKATFDGARYAVVGIAFLGLKEDIDLDFEDKDTDFEIPDYIEIEADTTNCDLSGMYLIISNSVFNGLDIDTSDYLDELQENVDKITDAMQELMDGSSELYQGLGTLLDGTNKLSDGVSELTDGLATIDTNSDALVSGSVKVFNTLLATVSKQMKDSGINVGNLTIDNYDEVLANVIEENCVTEVAKEKVVSQVNANHDAVEAAVRQAVSENVNEQVVSSYRTGVIAAIASQSGAPEEYVEANMGALIEQTLASKQDEIDATVAQQMESDQVKALISEKTKEQSEALIDQYMASEEVKTQISDGLKEIVSARESLNEYNSFYQGIVAYTNGVGEAYNGALEIKKNMPELVEGVKTLQEGEGKLSDGLCKFNEEVITKVIDLIDDTLEGMIEKFDTLTSVSKNYTAYDASGNLMKEGVKFIYKVG